MPPRLKALELHGYKTFAVKSHFEFPGMITAIVGPNGSGKSNIADALRWVLGEQSYSLLRGKKTEDMIFAGSEQRPRAGMASASIIFDNSDGWLPIDYSEVSITRRAYRDGQNEYLINGQKVRLREISELLAQSGLAERTYTIIGQGLVDAALALKPEERRRLFEEAAGIGLYRSRKEESLNHLVVTERNIERVEDILAELEPRLKSLEKQAHRAMEYDQIKSDLRVLLRDWYGFHWQHSQQDLKKAHDIMKTQEAKLEESRSHHKEIGQQVQMLRLKIQEQRNQLNSWHASSAECHNALEKINRELAILNERQRSSLDQESINKGDLNRLQGESLEILNFLEIAEQERIGLEGDLEDATQHANEARNKLQNQQSERSKFEKLMRDNRQLSVTCETRQIQTKAHLDELMNRLDQRKKERETSLQNIENDQNELVELKKEQEQLSLEYKDFLKRIENEETKLQETRKEIREFEKKQKTINDQHLILETEKAKVKAQIEIIEQAENTYSGFSEGAQFLNQSFKQERIKGGHRALTNLVQVPVDYEQAITSALGEYLDLIVLEKNVDLESVLNFLEGNNKGRTILLPVNQAKQVNPISPIEHPDYIGWASELVTYEEEFKPVIQAILGQVLVVNNRDTALILLAKVPPSTKVVTLKGEVFTTHGAIILGQGNRSGILSRPRQKHELNERISKLDQKLTLNNLETQKLTDLFNELRNQEAASIKEEQRLINQKDGIKGKVDRLTLTVNQIERQLDWLIKQRSGYEKEITRINLELEETGKTIVEFDKELKTIIDRIRQIQDTLNTLSLEENQREVNHWETEKAVLIRGLKDVQQKIEDRKKTLSNNQQQRSLIEKRLAELSENLKSIEEKKVIDKNQESEINHQIQAFLELINPLQKNLDECEGLYEACQKNENLAQQILTVAERSYSQAQMDLTRQRESLEILRRKIEDDFGLVSFDYEPTVAGPTPLPFEGMVEQLPTLSELPRDLEENISRQKLQLKRIGAINPEALSEYKTVQERHLFMKNQISDLRKAEMDLRQVISELDELMKRDFRKTFNAVANEFHSMFGQLFEGGSAHLILEDEEDINNAGIEIQARLPGKREQGLSLLSGGERSLTATALVFALLKVSPTPFCVMDEVDAMLDESNVGRFCALLNELSQNTQFIVITHNRNTVKMADVVYGITLGRDSISQIISLKLDEVPEDMAK